MSYNCAGKLTTFGNPAINSWKIISTRRRKSVIDSWNYSYVWFGLKILKNGFTLNSLDGIIYNLRL